jgi:putative acetyltransferase
VALHIRPETANDYAAIADLHARAFGGRPAEAIIVALHRHRVAFDPVLSLVAEDNGRIVGHVLFSPRMIRLLGENVPAVNLAPISVDPSRQGEGIGAALTREGHAVAAAKGYAISFLLGHVDYYVRFGYHPRAFGAAVARAAAPSVAPESLPERAPDAGDVENLASLWMRDQGGVDFAIAPGPALLDWLSPNPNIESTVYERDGKLVGYTRVHVEEPWQPRAIFVWDPPAARAIVATIAFQVGTERLKLPVHPSSVCAAACRTSAPEPWDAAMACPLLPSPLESYLARVRSGERIAGSPVWPVAFDL